MASQDVCVMPPISEYGQTGGAGSPGAAPAAPRKDVPSWPPPNVMGGDVQPVRTIFDPYPTFDGVAVDPESGRAFFTDSSLSGVLGYKTTDGSMSDDLTEPTTHVVGPNTGLGFMTGVAVDTERKEVYGVNNDGGGMVMFRYDSDGATRPVRHLETPHQSWGVAVSPERNEVAVSVQQLHSFVVYTRDAKGFDKPLRSVKGYLTGIADPHGIDIDAERREVVVANHGTWTEFRTYSPYDPLSKDPPSYQPGVFYPASVRFFDAMAEGNVKPKRVLLGDKTGLNWPMGLEVDAQRDEVAVANYGDDSVKFFRRSANGDVAPVREIKGDKTHIRGPVDVTIDRVKNELWVANYADHTAVVFDRDASGNAAPKRIVRNAPKGAPALTFTNASAAAYDTKRDALIVPN
jgi:6-phosphogluconolactonase (cycloisomerase 2 family)